jgi:transcriptional regulator of acetoin/glycerol metabolism
MKGSTTITLSKTTHRQLSAAVAKAVNETGDPVEVAKLCRSLAGIEETRGRPTAISQEQLAKAADLIAGGLPVAHVAEQLGLSRSTLASKLKRK